METLRGGNRQTFMQLLHKDQGAVKLRGAGGSTPLMYAALYGDAASVRGLLERGSDPNTANDAGATALIWAVEDFEKARMLVEHGADVNAMSGDGRTALAIALGNRGSAAVVKLLLITARIWTRSYTGAGACLQARAVTKRFCER
jgi:ankyrin repeat protein